MDLTEFLTARLNDDEAAAKVNGGWWTTVQTGCGIYTSEQDAARTLREVEAKRKILAGHQLRAEYEAPYDDVICAICGWATDVKGSGCRTLRALAAIYADHPDYDPAWKE